ncbi:hypothetical protein [Thalassotalea sp. G2M2-11]|uniref:hypothetical protein n=1 Tax=Thalassotalea sp. G2M2-11 TaxID=2787627 RepID=UPI0019CFF0FE|nr:hypothetical protein [Thalassotalea sp. G2M2-11]
MYSVIKWLIISVLVLFSFTIILLGLGSLLHENEQRVTAIKAGTSLSEPQEPVTQMASSHLTLPIKVQSTLKPIIKQNLTCVMDEQCVMVEAKFADLSCLIAINTIGAAKLARAEPDKTRAIDCPPTFDSAIARCHDNLCTLADRHIE